MVEWAHKGEEPTYGDQAAHGWETREEDETLELLELVGQGGVEEERKQQDDHPRFAD